MRSRARVTEADRGTSNDRQNWHVCRSDVVAIQIQEPRPFVWLSSESVATSAASALPEAAAKESSGGLATNSEINNRIELAPFGGVRRLRAINHRENKSRGQKTRQVEVM